ncbi:MAG: T9SS type B sorting domain-containing protein, partial [Bacteroidetes bacterium]|nr:T9SS type B sorting domain-containing protein [Bacteroidota bacterium]
SLFCTGFYSNTYCQLSVSTASTPQQLVQNVLVGGGVTISNVTYTGSSNQIGSFSGGISTNLGLSNGIVMSTGIVNGDGSSYTNPPLGDTVTEFSSTELWGLFPNGDNDIEALTDNQQTSYDASVLEFDFIPLSDTVKFRYVFASEEYPDYVCSTYNDAFGFFISGPGINGTYSNNSINIANIPGTTLPVAINSINNGTSGAYGSSANCTSLSYSSYYVDNLAISGGTIVFNGFTTVLTAWCIVTPCQQHHIKLAVADLGDAGYDSGVFLEAGSFTSTTITAATSSTNSALANDSTSIEGCTDNIITFQRVGSSIVNDLTVPLNIGGSAINGVDYTLIPDSVTFPAGQSSVTLTIHPISDGTDEGTEDIIFSISQNQNCTNYEMELKVYIVDQTPLNASILNNDTTFACPTPVNLDISASATGGNGTYSYLWNNGLGANSSIQVSPNTTTAYIITVTDQCAQQAIDSLSVIFLSGTPIQLLTSGDISICSGDTTSIFATATGGGGKYLFEWSDNLGSNDTVIIHPEQTTIYSISVTDSCGTLVSASFVVTIPSGVADFNYTFQTNSVVNFHNQTANCTIFEWNFGDGTTSDLQNPIHTYADTGIFIVEFTAINDIGCISIAQKAIHIYPTFYLFVPNAFTPDKDGLNDYFAPIAVGITKSSMQIYNRWGTLIYQSYENNPKWDGKDDHNNKAEQGIYVYVLNYETPTGTKFTKNGTITLIR